MKRFPAVLRKIIETNQQTQAEVGTLSGLGQLKISRLLNGVIRADKDDLSALFRALSDDDQKADLAIAHIRDEVPPETFKYIEIIVATTALKEGVPASSHTLSALERDAPGHILSMKEETPEIGDFLVSMAKLAGWHPRKPQK